MFGTSFLFSFIASTFKYVWFISSLVYPLSDFSVWTLVFLAQQNFTPRYFTDLIYLLPLPIVVLGLSDFKRFLFASFVTLSFYFFLQLSSITLFGFIEFIADSC